MDNPAIPRGSIVLVTGGNGFIGSHVCHQLLQQGYRVRATTRKLAKIAFLKERFQKEFGEEYFTPIEVPDFGLPGAYATAMEGCAGVIHVASNLSLSNDTDAVVNSVVEGDMNIIRTAAATPSVKRFVLTSSTKAGFWPLCDTKVYLDASSWNERSLTDAWTVSDEDPHKSLHIYCASKTLGERAIRKFLDEEKPGFVFNAVLPDLNFGEFLDLSSTRNESTGGYIADLYRGDTKAMMWFAQVPSWFVDVSDVARVHVGAMMAPDVENERIWAATEVFHINEILAIMRKLYPTKKFVEEQEGFGHDLSIIDNARGTDLLKRLGREGWISQEESIRLNTKDIDNLPPFA